MQKITLITGASRGIGAACARRLAADGNLVVVNYHRSAEAAQSLAKEIGGVALCADVSDKAACESMVQTVIKQYGRIDSLVCNAGVAAAGLFQCMDEQTLRQLYGINLFGVRNVIAAALPDMIQNQSGAIVTVSSVWGEVGASCEADYSASKAAVIGLTKAIAKEVAPSGIRVNCITPGVIDTEMNDNLDKDAKAALCEEIPLGRMGRAEEVAAAVRFLLSDEASYITGQILGIGGGF